MSFSQKFNFQRKLLPLPDVFDQTIFSFRFPTISYLMPCLFYRRLCAYFIFGYSVSAKTCLQGFERFILTMFKNFNLGF